MARLATKDELQAAVAKLGEPSENSRAIVYIGDGLSRANLFADPEMRELVEQLRKSLYREGKYPA